MLELKGFQQRSLTALESYLQQAVTMGAKRAFICQTNRPYLEVPKLPDLPYVCLRIPTGGGKTLVACHAVGVAVKEFLRQERAVCLWLVPSKPIREQTLKALRDRSHPYRQAVEAKLPGPVSVMDLTEALYVQPGTLSGETVVIVSTLQALRVTDTEGRKVYESAGALENHFSALSDEQHSLVEKRVDGSIPYSLANVLRLHRPIIIMDEAHNARTPLSFDTLSRLAPSVILEFTATPETTQKPEQEFFASNILCHCSAAELKSEDMIKLPVKLETRPDPKETISHALQMQRELEKSAAEEERATGEHIRPIILFQAEARSAEAERFTVDKVREALVNDFKIPEVRIAVSTGDKDELEGVDLSARDCPIRYVITVQKLREGWDCPFAYVLCSVQHVYSARAVEQVMGRVLRMPKARRKTREDLNCAYAFVASEHFAHAAQSLKDALVENGFERMETEDLVIASDRQPEGTGFLPLFREPIVEPVPERPDLSKLSAAGRATITYDERTETIQVPAGVSDATVLELSRCFGSPSGREVAERILARRRGCARPKSPSERGVPFEVPQLAVRVGKQLELFEEDHFLDGNWELTEAEATLSESLFPVGVRRREAAAVDVNADGRLDVEVRYAEELFKQLSFVSGEPGWTLPALVNWLDRQFPHPDLTQTQTTWFIRRIVTGLMEARGLTLDRLALEKFRLRSAIAERIGQLRAEQRKKGFQRVLFGKEAEIEVSPELVFSFGPNDYGPNWFYDGTPLPKHYYPRIGELKSEGEEFECARYIAEMDEVDCWVRNLDKDPQRNFWLQTSTDRFYPDFVAKLKDGRNLVVESKGEHLWSNDDSKEKRAIGELWAERSGGRCLFVMPKGKDWADIRKRVA